MILIFFKETNLSREWETEVQGQQIWKCPSLCGDGVCFCFLSVFNLKFAVAEKVIMSPQKMTVKL